MKARIVLLLCILLFASACTPETIIETVEKTVEVTREIPVTTTPEPTSTPTPLPDLIFEDDFEAGAGDWYVTVFEAGYMDVSEGALQFSIDAPEYWAWLTEPNLEDLWQPYILEVEVERIMGDRASYAWILTRYNNDDFFSFEFDGEGWMTFGVNFEGEYYDIIPWSQMDAISTSKNLIKVIDDGESQWYYANDELLFMYPVTSLDPGTLAFGAGSWEEGGVVWEFDNLVVREYEAD